MVDINREPHTTDNDAVAEGLVKSLKSVRSGRIVVDMGNEHAIDVNVDESTKRVSIDILDSELFKLFTSAVSEKVAGSTKQEDIDKDGGGTVDKIKAKLSAAKEFAHMLVDNETELFDKLATAKHFAQKLTENDMTVAVLRKGKEAIVLGKEAKPSISKLVSGSDDVQIKSVSETTKLASDLSPDEKT